MPMKPRDEAAKEPQRPFLYMNGCHCLDCHSYTAYLEKTAHAAAPSGAEALFEKAGLRCIHVIANKNQDEMYLIRPENKEEAEVFGTSVLSPRAVNELNRLLAGPTALPVPEINNKTKEKE